MSERSYVWCNWSALKFTRPGFRKNYRLITNHYEFGVDRFGILENVEDLRGEVITKIPTYNLSNLTNDWFDRYTAVTNKVADNVYKLAGDKVISLSYSGGVDSVQVLCALAQHPKFKEKLEAGQFVIAMTNSSILEYPKMFYEFILPNIPIVPLDHERDMIDDNVMLVTGDSGDYCIGTSDINGWWHDPNKTINLSAQELISVWREIDEDGRCVEPLIAGLLKHAPFEIKSVAQLAWWFSQCFAVQDELVRPYVWSPASVEGMRDDDHKVFRFFYDHAFITFSYEYMSTNPVFDKLTDFRDFPKQYIYNYTKDQHYVDNKEKLYSQRHAVRKIQKTMIYNDGSKLTWTDDITDIVVI